MCETATTKTTNKTKKQYVYETKNPEKEEWQLSKSRKRSPFMNVRLLQIGKS